MREFTSYEREIFKTLYAADMPVDAYKFFVQFKLSPGHIAKFLKNSRDKQLITFHDGQLSLTKSGRKYVVDNKDKIYLKGKQPWQKIPEYMTENHDVLGKKGIFDLSKNDIESFLNY